MLIFVDFGYNARGHSAKYTVLNPDLTLAQLPTSEGVNNFGGAGMYGVDVPYSLIAGKTVLWMFVGPGSKFAAETFPDYPTLVNEALSAGHGAGSWESTGGLPVIPVVAGVPRPREFAEKISLQLTRGDTYRIPFAMGGDWTGYAGQFGARIKTSDGTYSSAYSMPLRATVWTDQANGLGYFDLTTADTAAAGLHYGEVQFTNADGQVHTRYFYTLGIVADVIR